MDPSRRHAFGDLFCRQLPSTCRIARTFPVLSPCVPAASRARLAPLHNTPCSISCQAPSATALAVLGAEALGSSQGASPCNRAPSATSASGSETSTTSSQSSDGTAALPEVGAAPSSCSGTCVWDPATVGESSETPLEEYLGRARRPWGGARGEGGGRRDLPPR